MSALRDAMLGLVLGCVPLTGCGFSPLYANKAGMDTTTTVLGEVDVLPIPNHEGQELRSDLVNLLGSDASDAAAQFDLHVDLTLTGSGISINPQTASTHTRLNASAAWTLSSHDQQHTVVKRGVAVALDGFDIINQQFFAADLSGSAAIRRLDDELARQIVEQIGLYFQMHPKHTG